MSLRQETSRARISFTNRSAQPLRRDGITQSEDFHVDIAVTARSRIVSYVSLGGVDDAVLVLPMCRPAADRSAAAPAWRTSSCHGCCVWPSPSPPWWRPRAAAVALVVARAADGRRSWSSARRAVGRQSPVPPSCRHHVLRPVIRVDPPVAQLPAAATG